MNQHEIGSTVLAPRSATTHAASATHPRLTERRLVAACQAANDRLTPAFLRVATHLARDPEPRHAWANRRRASNPLPCPSFNLVQYTQRALLEAVLSGDRDAIEKTALEVEALGAEMLAAMLAPYTAYAHGEPSFITSGLAATKEVSEASAATTRALVTRSAGDIEAALHESIEAVVAIESFCEAARHEAAPRRLQVTR